MCRCSCVQVYALISNPVVVDLLERLVADRALEDDALEGVALVARHQLHAHHLALTHRHVTEHLHKQKVTWLHLQMSRVFLCGSRNIDSWLWSAAFPLPWRIIGFCPSTNSAACGGKNAALVHKLVFKMGRELLVTLHQLICAVTALTPPPPPLLSVIALWAQRRFTTEALHELKTSFYLLKVVDHEEDVGVAHLGLLPFAVHGMFTRRCEHFLWAQEGK